tara:strand:- start:4113 stop:4673 length:561 start_codon:yes stop_codon:yes gene_type:complete
MRIISGYLKGKKIILPLDKKTRPLRDMVKESIFNIMKHSNKINCEIEDSKILDLFSGCGSFGLECISRGASKVYFNENYPEALKILKKNINALSCEKKISIIEKDCFQSIKGFKKFDDKFNIIFIDPPFKEKRLNYLLELIIDNKILDNDGVIIIHRHKNENEEILKKFKILDERDYGISKIIFGN